MRKQILLFVAITLMASCDDNDNNTTDPVVAAPGAPGAPGTPGVSSVSSGAVTVSSKLTDPDTNFKDVTFPDATTGYIVGNKIGSKAIIYKTTNGGADWTAKETSMTAITKLFFVNNTTGFATGQTFVSDFAPDFIKTLDGGATWIPLNVPVTNDERLDALFFTDANTGYVSGQQGKIYKTTNAGTSWNMVFDSTAEIQDIFFIDANTGFAVGSKGTILKTTDAGNTWTAKTSGDTNFITAIKFVDATTGIAVSGSGKILKTTDSGETWVTVATISKSLTDIAFANDKILVSGSAGDYNASENVIVSSTDKGVNWVTQTVSGPKGINAAHFFTDTKGFIAGGSGIYEITISHTKS